MEAVSVKWACVLLSTVARFGVFCVGVICGVIDVFDGLFSVIHAAVTDLDCVTINDFSKFVVFREVLVY